MSATERRLREFTTIPQPSRISPDGVLSDVAVLGRVSSNGYTYPPEVLAQVAAGFEGAPSYEGHAEILQDGSIRPQPASKYIGRFENLRVKDGQVRGDFRIVNRQYRSLFEDVTANDPRAFGFSTDGLYEIDVQTGNPKQLKRAFSIDLVTRPATVRGLFEEERMTELERLQNENERLTKMVAALEEQVKAAKEPINESALEALQKKIEEIAAENVALRRQLCEQRVRSAFMAAQIVADDVLREAAMMHADDPAKLDKFVASLAKLKSVPRYSLNGVSRSAEGDSYIDKAFALK